jgi:hypothetical protein
MKLDRSHLGKIVRLDKELVLELPDGVFKEGDILVLFNNTDKSTCVQSKVKNSYHSGRGERTLFDFPRRSLLNILFVSDDTVVFTAGL